MSVCAAELSFILVVVLFAVVCTAAPATINDNGTHFNVTVGNVLIFQHSPENPMLYVGNGSTSFMEFSGNFRIEDNINSRLGLASYVHNNYNWTDEFIFSGAGHQVIFRMTLYSDNWSIDIDMRNSVNGSRYDYTWLRVVAEPTEQIYGGGEQFTHLNLREYSYIPNRDPETFAVDRERDQVYPIWTREQGVGRDRHDQVAFMADKLSGAGGSYHTTYFPQPTFISSRKYLYHYSGYNYMKLDFSHRLYHEIFIKGPVTYMSFVPTNKTNGMMDLVSGLVINQVGRMAAPPTWIRDGIILGVQGGTDIMMKRLKAAQDQGVAVNGLWIQDWAGIKNTTFGQRLFWNWKWNPKRYPGLDEKIKELKTQGIRVLAYINPNLNIEGDMFKEAASKDYVVKNSTNQAYLLDFGEFYCGIVDLSKPEAFNWYKGQITTNMIKLGLGGWMADFGEYLPVDAVVADKTVGIEDIHNKWPLLWARLNREAVEEAGKLGEIVFWMRAGAADISNYTTMMWAGDQNVDFGVGDGLPSTIVAASSMGMSGTGLTHFDIGGYTTYGTLGLVRTEELLLRSAEMAVFTPMMRTHEGNQPDYNVQAYSSPNILQQFARLVEMYRMLANYTLSVIEECTTRGIPAQRPMVLHYEEDQIAVNSKYQYMYGSDLLVAPVIKPNMTTQTVYLPMGDWVFLWNSSVTSKGNEQLTVPAPVGQPPVFYKQSSSYSQTFIAISKIPLVPPTPKPTPKPQPNSGSILHTTCSLVMVSIGLLYIKQNLFLK